MQTDVMSPTIVTGGALGALILALNHYVATSEVVGSALAQRYGRRTAILIPINPHHPTDVQDLAALRARLEELADELPVQMEVVRGHGATNDVWVLGIDDEQIQPLTDALVQAPGSLGWGSSKLAVDRLRTLD